jgi:hypothetical protein
MKLLLEKTNWGGYKPIGEVKNEANTKKISLQNKGVRQRCLTIFTSI